MDFWTRVSAHRRSLADDLAAVTDAQWDTPSLCAGWTVRDVVAHQSGTAAMNPLSFFARFARARFDFPRFAATEIQRHRGDSPAATLARFRELQDSTSAPPGPKMSWLGEVLVHNEDVRRPLGIAHDYPAEDVRDVIDFYKTSNTLIGTKDRIAGLRLVATDQDWTHGEGDLVEGRLLDLLMAATGRAAGCDDLAGEGVETLRARCA